MDPYPEIHQVIEDMEAMSDCIFDLDLMEVLESDMASSFPRPLYGAPPEEFGPQQPQTECNMAPGTEPLSQQQPLLPEPGFHAAQTGLALLPSHYAPAKEQFGPQQPQTECNMAHSFPRPLYEAPTEEFDPQQPQTGCYRPPGAAPLSHQQQVFPDSGFQAAQTDFPLLPSHYTPAKEEFGPQQPQTECNMAPGAAPLSQQQPVLPEPGFHAAQTGLALLPSYYTPAKEQFGPQQPQTGCYMPPGAAPFGQQQHVLPEPGFQAAQTDFPLLPPYYAAPEDMFGPQPPHTECYMPPGAAPFRIPQPIMPAPDPASPMYQPNFLPSDYTYYRSASLDQSQVRTMTVMSLPQRFGSNLAPVASINGKGQLVYGFQSYAAPPVAPEVKAQAPQKRKYFREPEDESRPYITKPPNAFMMFRMEQRPKVVLQINTPDCAAVNKVIGQTWRSLSKEEQAKYYHQADVERQLHSKLFPDWSAGDNYGIKKKRIRRKGPALTEDSDI